VGPKAGLDDMEKRKFLTLPGLELGPLDRPARSQFLSVMVLEEKFLGMMNCIVHADKHISSRYLKKSNLVPCSCCLVYGRYPNRIPFSNLI
jgi:hypothetical protein